MYSDADPRCRLAMRTRMDSSTPRPLFSASTSPARALVNHLLRKWSMLPHTVKHYISNILPNSNILDCCSFSTSIPPETLQLPLSVFEPAKCNFRNPGIRAILSDNWRHCLQRRSFSFFGVVAKRHLEIKVSHNVYMLPRGGPAQRASCGL